eukprot:6182627-Pleurochrysis_carterae.AAC.1
MRNGVQVKHSREQAPLFQGVLDRQDSASSRCSGKKISTPRRWIFEHRRHQWHSRFPLKLRQGSLPPPSTREQKDAFSTGVLDASESVVTELFNLTGEDWVYFPGSAVRWASSRKIVSGSERSARGRGGVVRDRGLLRQRKRSEERDQELEHAVEHHDHDRLVRAFSNPQKRAKRSGQKGAADYEAPKDG